MALLEYIRFTPMRECIENGVVNWEIDRIGRVIERLPQIFWSTGDSWSEVNLWAADRTISVSGSDMKTISALMKHLCAYADWLEAEGIDWRHFPKRMADRCLVRYRGNLIRQRDSGLLKPSTTTARMRAVIQFYRFSLVQGFVSRNAPVWKDRMAVIRYFDVTGFERTLMRVSSDLAIPNRARPGLALEDGLTSIGAEHVKNLLEFTAAEQLDAIHLMLSLGFFTGARIGTIATLRVGSVEDAMPDPSMTGLYRIPVGPGTGVQTKFSVSGDLLVPRFLIDALRRYTYSIPRLARQAKATAECRHLLFLTSRGNPYRPESFNRLMTDLRRRAVRQGLHFMSAFRFHQTRCTYGTWLMEIALRVAGEAAAIAFVRDAMFHKDEAVTLRYVRFLQQAPIKATIANEFTVAFSGVRNRNWNSFDA
ncbi:site-specific integrase [Paraburkholderia sp. J94]|uniref:site-specific integrase n=1 Tax=Paraburkholderia sp. J94 TaxID=2805441 RepID=UPI002AB30967|nr:site-specific integrase [Paraburkholderia sp. J94]